MSKPKTAQSRRVRISIELSAEEFESIANEHAAFCREYGITSLTKLDCVQIVLESILITELKMRASRAAIQRGEK